MQVKRPWDDCALYNNQPATNETELNTFVETADTASATSGPVSEKFTVVNSGDSNSTVICDEVENADFYI
jgi:hypothetical protein